LKNSNLKEEKISRTKRSWSSFWSSVFGTATAEDLKGIYSNEVSILNEEKGLKKTVSKLADSNSQVFDNIKKVSDNLDTLNSKQQNIYDHLRLLINEEESEISSLLKLAKIQDHTTTLISEYLVLQTQILFILTTLRDFSTLIASILTNTIDFSQIPTGPLRSALPHDFILSIKNAKAEFRFDSQGYYIQFTVPKFMESFTVYSYKQIPFLTGKLWFRIAEVPDILVLNWLNEYISFEEVEKRCKPQEDRYICDLNSIVIQKFTSEPCMLQLVHTFFSEKSETTSCKLEGVHYVNEQDYLIRNDTLIVSNSINNTYIQKMCAGVLVNTTSILIYGVSKFNFEYNCIYTTEGLTI
jgi:uncharacterized protein YoxC